MYHSAWAQSTDIAYSYLVIFKTPPKNVYFHFHILNEPVCQNTLMQYHVLYTDNLPLVGLLARTSGVLKSKVMLNVVKKYV